MPYEPPRHCASCGAPLAQVEGAPGQRRCAGQGCGRVTYLSPTPVVAAVVEHEGHAVLVRGHGWPSGWWGLVTGFLEPGENPQDAARREVKEELGLEAEESDLIGAYAFPPMNQVIIAYHLRTRGEIALDGRELEGVKRVPLDRLKPWNFGTGAAVRDFLARRQGRASSAEAPSPPPSLSAAGGGEGEQ